MDGRQRFKINAAKSMQNVRGGTAADARGPLKTLVQLGGAGGLGSGPGPGTQRSARGDLAAFYQTQDPSTQGVSSK